VPPTYLRRIYMSMSISAVGNVNLGSFDPSKMASMVASKMMSDLDPNNTGKVSKDHFISTLTSKGVSVGDATKMYNSIDTKGNGYITKSDIESAVKSGSLKPPAGGPPGGAAQGPGGAGAGGGPGGAGAASQTVSSKSSQSYAPADTNQDGTVSPEEAAVYALKHSSDASSVSKSATNVKNRGVDVWV
jgi:hypothetical protein